MRSFSIFTIPLHDIEWDDLLAQLLHVRGLIVTPNPEILLAARKNEEYASVLRHAALSLPDGIATVFAVAALHDVCGLHRYPGVDMVSSLASAAEHNGETLLIVGGFSQDYEKIIQRLRGTHPQLSVICLDPGIVSDAHTELSSDLVETIRAIGPAVALVALGQGKGRQQGRQEFFAKNLLAVAPHVRCAIGIGGAIDVLAGRVLRAPLWFRKNGFEWVWRLGVHPWRIVRIFRAVIVFPTLIAWDTLKHKHFFRALRSVSHSIVAHLFIKSV